MKNKACESWKQGPCTYHMPISTGPKQRACSSWHLAVWC